MDDSLGVRLDLIYNSNVATITVSTVCHFQNTFIYYFIMTTLLNKYFIPTTHVRKQKSRQITYLARSYITNDQVSNMGFLILS